MLMECLQNAGLSRLVEMSNLNRENWPIQRIAPDPVIPTYTWQNKLHRLPENF